MSRNLVYRHRLLLNSKNHIHISIHKHWQNNAEPLFYWHIFLFKNHNLSKFLSSSLDQYTKSLVHSLAHLHSHYKVYEIWISLYWFDILLFFINNRIHKLSCVINTNQNICRHFKQQVHVQCLYYLSFNMCIFLKIHTQHNINEYNCWLNVNYT